jgi:hypothetical protein
MRQRHLVDEGVPATTWAGASICVVLCMVVVILWLNTPDLAM